MVGSAGARAAALARPARPAGAPAARGGAGGRRGRRPRRGGQVAQRRPRRRAQGGGHPRRGPPRRRAGPCSGSASTSPCASTSCRPSCTPPPARWASRRATSSPPSSACSPPSSARWRSTTSALLQAYRARDALRGHEVAWSGGRGTAAGIDGAGRLVVELAGGGRTALSAGEVHLRALAARRGAYSLIEGREAAGGSRRVSSSSGVCALGVQSRVFRNSLWRCRGGGPS